MADEAGEAFPMGPEEWDPARVLTEVELSGGKSLRGSTCTMAGAKRPEAGRS